MAGALSDQLGERFRQLGMDIDVDRYGDPHVAFVVIVYPDREPEIVVVSERTQQAIRNIRASEDENKQKDDGAGRFFEYVDFKAAADAMGDADFGFLMASWNRGTDKGKTMGQVLADYVQERWRNRIDNKIRQALAAADHDAKYSEKCAGCGRKFTTRGIKMHRARAKSQHCAAPKTPVE